MEAENSVYTILVSGWSVSLSPTFNVLAERASDGLVECPVRDSTGTVCYAFPSEIPYAVRVVINALLP